MQKTNARNTMKKKSQTSRRLTSNRTLRVSTSRPQRASAAKTSRTQQSLTASRTQRTNMTAKRTQRANVNHQSFHGLFLEELQELYSIENQLIQALPLMAKAANSSDLKQALRDHLKETQEQAKRLEHIFRQLEHKPQSKRCQGMQQILCDGECMVSGHKLATRDAAIIAAAQKIEHYEIASYGIARAHAKCLGMNEAADLLDRSLDEESAADKRLSKLAEGSIFYSGVNKQAVKEEAMAFA